MSLVGCCVLGPGTARLRARIQTAMTDDVATAEITETLDQYRHEKHGLYR